MSNYQAFVRTVCSHKFALSNVSQPEILAAFSRFIEAAEELDRIKKAIFYDKPLEEPIFFSDATIRVLNFEHVHQDAFHGIIGICTEAGELAQRLLLMAENPNEEHRINLIEELGDVGWYEALLQALLGVSPEFVREVNERKLRQRYGGAFTASAAVQRDMHGELRAMNTQVG